jgi:murein tripeptide amidase MpaA
MPATDALWKWATAMNTARQAMENMEYVRRLLEEKAGWIRRVRGIGPVCYPPSDRAAGGKRWN